jgi:hypothetical protein
MAERNRVAPWVTHRQNLRNTTMDSTPVLAMCHADGHPRPDESPSRGFVLVSELNRSGDSTIVVPSEYVDVVVKK